MRHWPLCRQFTGDRWITWPVTWKMFPFDVIIILSQVPHLYSAIQSNRIYSRRAQIRAPIHIIQSSYASEQSVFDKLGSGGGVIQIIWSLTKCQFFLFSTHISFRNMIYEITMLLLTLQEDLYLSYLVKSVLSHMLMHCSVSNNLLHPTFHCPGYPCRSKYIRTKLTNRNMTELRPTT